LTFEAILFIIIKKASSLGSIRSDRSGRSPPEVRRKGEEPMASVPKDSKELRRIKWQFKRQAENEVERAFFERGSKKE
jgi:hypothetical protein